MPFWVSPAVKVIQDSIGLRDLLLNRRNASPASWRIHLPPIQKFGVIFADVIGSCLSQTHQCQLLLANGLCQVSNRSPVGARSRGTIPGFAATILSAITGGSPESAYDQTRAFQSFVYNLRQVFSISLGVTVYWTCSTAAIPLPRLEMPSWPRCR